ncbi:hypothetical protein [Mycoplasmopsis cynos]|uniref:hypothetical protein n=1 Tax=Mycoplasmopsis cynos TaxID=171284 RepID=UPI00220A8091|nr:hypothetical protein [Mycoplasmopsis cynos]UWV81386.1 hypothetical protein NW065_05620 [Mycoplasmopsis cynos]
MLYGSAYWPSLNSRTEKNFTGNVSNADDNNNQVYKILIDSFADLIKDGTGYEIKDNKHITFKGDGLEIVNDLINPARPDVNPQYFTMVMQLMHIMVQIIFQMLLAMGRLEE